MRALGYPRPISLENFRSPNFALVAEILDWLVCKYDPTAHVPESLETESARVAFLTSVAATIAAKARIVLKTKSLYAADGRAVKEMLKVARVLYRCVWVGLPRWALASGVRAPALRPFCRPTEPCSAMRTCQQALVSGDEEDAVSGAEGFSLNVKPAEVATLRAASTEITESGARLHELLRREGEVRDARVAALRFLEAASGNLNARAETEYVERCIRDAISLAKVRCGLRGTSSGRALQLLRAAAALAT